MPLKRRELTTIDCSDSCSGWNRRGMDRTTLTYRPMAACDGAEAELLNLMPLCAADPLAAVADVDLDE